MGGGSMKRWLIATALLSLGLWLSRIDAQDTKPPTIKEVMKKINYRDAALCPLVGRALKADQPSWDEVQRQTRQLAQLADALALNDPPRGEKASWQQLTKAYIASAHELDQAAQRQDRAAALAAHARLANPAGCNGCHKEHRNQ
jgi:hypothetical protein